MNRPRLAASAFVAVLLGATYLIAPSSAGAATPAAYAVKASTAAAATARNPVIKEPPMGWNDWNTFGCNVNAKLIEQTADTMVSSGLRDAGYKYVNIDDCWSEKTRSADGKLVPDPAKFPDGIKGVADYVHARGLELGLYADAGTATCAGYPGSLGHEKVDAQTFADWGVDLLKYDNCNNTGVPAQQRYQAMSDALAATDRKIVFSICEWGTNKPWRWAPAMGDYWRIEGDINDSWSSIRSIGRQLMRVGNGWSGPGYPDPDMLEVGNGGLTPTEARAHFGLWSLYGAPLILGNDVRNMDADSRAVVTNRDVIAVDQQAAGHAVRQVSADHANYVLARSMDDGSVVMGLYNESDTPAAIRTTAAAAGVPAAHAYSVRDLWDGTTSTSTGKLAAQVPAHGLTLLEVKPTKNPSTAAPALTLTAPRVSGAEEFLAGPDGIDTTLTISEPKTGGILTDLEATVAVPAGWATKDDTTIAVPKLKPGESRQWTWHLTPTGKSSGTAMATVAWSHKSVAHSRDLALRLTPTPATPQGRTSVAELPWIHAWAGYLSPKRNTGIEGQTLAVNGQTFTTGVGSHGESEVAVWLGGNCSRFTTDVGLQDGTNAGGSIQGVVEGDGKALASSDVMKAGMPAQHLSVDVTGVDYLVLHTLTGGDSSYGDRVSWGGTNLTCSGLDVQAPKVFVPGQKADVTTSVTASSGGATDVSTKLTVPDGWTASPTTPTTTSSLAAGDTFTTTWAVTPPTDAPSGSAQLMGQATYTADGKTRTDTKPVTTSVARSPHYVFSQSYDGPSYKRLTKTVTVPPGGGSLSFWTDYDAEQGWDYLFVEAHTPGQDDWTTLPDANGSTSTSPGDSCANDWVTLHPQLAHYQTYSNGSCTSSGTTGSWNAATGSSGGWKQWKLDLSKWAGKQVEVSISYASDWGGQGAGVWLDDATLPDGTTNTFEDGLDGWSVAGAPPGDPANPNDFIVADAGTHPAP